MKYLKSYNESIRDYLKPKTEEDVMKYFEGKKPTEILFHSVLNGHIAGIQYAMDKGVDINTRFGFRSYTALMVLSAENGDDAETFKFLLDNGADPYLENDEGYDALELAEDMENEKIVELLYNWMNKDREKNEMNEPK